MATLSTDSAPHGADIFPVSTALEGAAHLTEQREERGGACWLEITAVLPEEALKDALSRLTDSGLLF